MNWSFKERVSQSAALCAGTFNNRPNISPRLKRQCCSKGSCIRLGMLVGIVL